MDIMTNLYGELYCSLPDWDDRLGGKMVGDSCVQTSTACLRVETGGNGNSNFQSDTIHF